MSAAEGTRLLKAAKDGDFQAFAKLLSWLERSPAGEALSLKPFLKPTRAAFRIGVTGPPGAGKSTLVGRLIRILLEKKLKIGVLAVDPSSPFTHGAILGDRIRYSEHFLNQSVFIRSLGTRGSLGGLSSAAFLMARAFDACAFDVLLIETVGVGQTELDVLHVADQVCVVLVPESGDSIQAMKAGLMEIADVFVVNKADRPGADGLAREIEASIHFGESVKEIRVLKCVASEGTGVEELAETLLGARSRIDYVGLRSRPERLREEAKALLRRQWEDQVDKKLKSVHSADDLRRLFKTARTT
jgi:LAO/AO transport system kinase